MSADVLRGGDTAGRARERAAYSLFAQGTLNYYTTPRLRDDAENVRSKVYGTTGRISLFH
jgi:hypothetical protein